MVQKRRLLMIHGYNHDPETPQHSPFREGGNFDLWPKIFLDHETVPLAWYSAVQKRDLWRALKNGCRNTYVFAYTVLADDAVRKALEITYDLVGPYMSNIPQDAKMDIVAHSLGTRVALLLLRYRPDAFNRVILLNGSETVKQAMGAIVHSPKVRFLNVAVHTDDVLAYLGAWGAPVLWGKDPVIGNGFKVYPGEIRNMEQIILDNVDQKYEISRRYGWKIDGDNPDNIGDHSFSFLNHRNWPLYRAFFDGRYPAP